MRTRHRINEARLAFFGYRVSQGTYLKDVAYEELCAEARADIGHEARHLCTRTNLELRRVKRRGRKVWRFIDRN